MQRIVNPFVYNFVNQGMPNPTIPAWLDETYSQNYEDIVICQMLEAYMIRNQKTHTTVSFLEIGGNHPVCTSASFLFKKLFGCNGIIVEPDPKLAEDLRKYRAGDLIIESAVIDTDEKEIEFFISTRNELSTLSSEFVQKNNLDVKSVKVSTIRINQLLDMLDGIDSVLLSIDVEGLDLRVLKDIDFTQYRPHFITIEPSEHIVPGTTQQIVSFLNDNDYRLAAKNYVNLIFEDKRK
jgi:FkbM family methyltransferase